MGNAESEVIRQSLLGTASANLHHMQCLGDEEGGMGWVCVPCEFSLPQRRVYLLRTYFQDPATVEKYKKEVIEPVLIACRALPVENRVSWLNEACAGILYTRVSNYMARTIIASLNQSKPVPSTFIFQNGCGCNEGYQCPQMKIIVMILTILDFVLEKIDKEAKAKC